VENFHVYPDPRARFADPTNPDRPPMPPDDPAAWDLSPHPQKPPKETGVRQVEGLGYLDYLAACTAQNRVEETAKTEPVRSGAVETAEPPVRRLPRWSTPTFITPSAVV